MTTPADTPVPPHLSDAERALWEKASAVIAASQRDNEAAAHDGGDSPLAMATNGAWLDAMQAFSHATTPESVRSLLTALSSEREAEERDRKDNRELRKEWWLAHCAGIHAGNIAALYGDDGEMQCSACRLDFKRQPVAELQAELWLLALKRAAAPSTETPHVE